MPVHATEADDRWRRVAVVGLVLLVGSLTPSPFARRESFETYGPDKWVHFLAHGVFTVTLTDALTADGTGTTVSGGSAVGCSVLLGLVIGHLQKYVPGRAPELADLIAGALGSILGLGWWYRNDG